MDTAALVIIERRGRVGLARLNRPRELNALNPRLMSELMEALGDFDADESVGAIVIAGNERAFAAGADIRDMAGATSVEMLKRDPIGYYDRIRGVKKPVIAAVSGWCLGGGNELALSCDMIVASETARFGQPEINIGVIPGAGGTQRLTRALGKALAMEVILGNRVLSAQEALHHGLINRVVPVERYLDEALELAEQIAQRAPLALRLAKQAVNNAFETSLSEGIANERRAFYLLFSTEDQKEGMAAFIEKRSPEWKGQ
ncbi:MAG: enoyl-CoA hydratase/isomerase family protein [Anaerolineales bacterium]|nr:enoyl-CoA hydratase/isomerase family protein [Anaerolineales bacterium]